MNPFTGEADGGQYVRVRYPNGWLDYGWLAASDDLVTVEGAMATLLDSGDEILVEGQPRRIHGIRTRFATDRLRPSVATKSYADLTLHRSRD